MHTHHRKPVIASFVVVWLMVCLGCSGGSDSAAGSQSWHDPARLDSALVVDWCALALKMTRDTAGYTPPVAARAFGYLGVALYEAVRPGMTGYRTLQGQIGGLAPDSLPVPAPFQDHHWGIVANETLARILFLLYPGASDENQEALETLRERYRNAFSPGVDGDVIDRSLSFGTAMADAVYAYAVSDGQEFAYLDNFPADYVPPEGEGLWVPTPPSYQRAMQPYWGQVRPFLEINRTHGTPPAPMPFSTDEGSAFYAQALEVYQVSVNLTEEEAVIARFWSDDPGTTSTPPGHSLSILIQVLEEEGSSLGLAAEACAKIGMALHDAFVCCWRTKFTYNLIRPITYIRERIDPAFTPVVTTPPFPEYTSGHSVQSGASAEILTDLFGDGYAFDDRTHAGRTDIDGTPRHFDSFYAFADEAAISRLYGGIHYREAIEVGVDQGIQIGQNVLGLTFRE